MGRPEWEDRSIDEGASSLGHDHFRPDWWASSLKGWKRPRWFVQGPSALCIEYLGARNSGQRLLAFLKWLELEVAALRDARPAETLGPSANMFRSVEILALAGTPRRFEFVHSVISGFDAILSRLIPFGRNSKMDASGNRSRIR